MPCQPPLPCLLHFGFITVAGEVREVTEELGAMDGSQATEQDVERVNGGDQMEDLGLIQLSW